VDSSSSDNGFKNSEDIFSSIKNFFQWAIDSISGLFTAFRSKESIREELINKLVDVQKDPEIKEVIVKAVGKNVIGLVGDKIIHGGITEETSHNIEKDITDLSASLSAEEKSTIQDIQDLLRSGHFTKQEFGEMLRKSDERATASACR
jgi:hypothetical protein